MTTFMREFERDPAKAIRKRLEECWAQMAQQDAATARAAEQERYRASYAARRTGAEARTLSGESSALSQRNDAPAGPMRA